MEGPAKLARTSSSILRSPTIRSITSLSAIDEDDGTEFSDDRKKKTHKPMSSRTRPFSSLSSSSCCLHSALTSSPLLPITIFSLSSLTIFLFFYFRYVVPTLTNLLLAFTSAAAIVSFFARKLKSSKLWTNKGGIRTGESVKWFIGDEMERPLEKEKGNGEGGRTVIEGVVFYGNGDYYEGEFHNGKCNGNGVYCYLGNGRYEGDWVDGRYDGYGVESWARGSRFRGMYRQGLRHGFGVYRFYTGDSFAGEWFHGQSHGVGVQTCSDGSCYAGEFKRGVKHGIGCYHFRNGDKYAGEYFGDKIHGFGVYHFANGHCYEGSWHEGKKQGFGSYIFRNGEAKSGEWDCGVLKTSHLPASDAVQYAVQAARRAEANAIMIPRVDNQVDKAEAAANRSATAARVAAIKAVQNRMDRKFCNIDV